MWKLGNEYGQHTDHVFDEGNNPVAFVVGMPPLDFTRPLNAKAVLNAALIAAAPVMFQYLCRKAAWPTPAQEIVHDKAYGAILRWRSKQT